MAYDFASLEKKWQDRWAAAASSTKLTTTGGAKKRYLLAMFPYPSGEGLHVGHVGIYTATDVLARYWRRRGEAVFAPMGFDAFGLPAENFAIKKGVPPQETTDKNIVNFRRQMDSVGFSFDWESSINTSHPDYYRWTQWLFLQLYQQGLAYQAEAAVNWCDSCQTVLANEQAEGGLCERCRGPVIQKQMRQWFFKITAFADDLLSGLDELDWPEKIKQAQRNWIGRSHGARLTFAVADRDEKIEVFTTRADTLYGCTYLVLAPEHPLVEQISTDEQRPKVLDYARQASKKSELERTFLDKSKTGVFTGAYAINPINSERVPIWVADYVVMNYGTGAIMAVPAHDERDFEFATRYKLPIKQVVTTEDGSKTALGKLINSGSHTGLESAVAAEQIAQAAGGKMETMYRLRDWLVSRQRYWGAPIPIIYCDKCGAVPVPEDQLPVRLPEDVDFKPTGHSPLDDSASFQNGVVCPKCGAPARREVDTMDTFVCSSWYFLRYPSVGTQTADLTPFDPKMTDEWLPVDEYVGGAEHAVLHLLYARFITRALSQAGLVKMTEPFSKLRTIGLILGPDHQKMSKSRGNVINPDEVVDAHGADTLRLHELFLGPFADEKPWNTDTIKGVERFLETVDRLTNLAVAEGTAENGPADERREGALQRTIQKVTADLAEYRFNTALSSLMSLTHEFDVFTTAAARRQWATFIELLSPLAPHLASDCWERMGNQDDLHARPWPAADEAKAARKQITWVVMINGKRRVTFEAAPDLQEDEAVSQAKAAGQTALQGHSITKTIYVPGRLVNFVVSD